MDDIIYDSLQRYFKGLTFTGYKSYGDVYKMLFLLLIRDFAYNDFQGHITEEDYKLLERSVYKVFGTACLIPFPQFCKTRTMNKLHLGNITELAYLVKSVKEDSELAEAFEEFKKTTTTSIDSINADIDGLKKENVIKANEVVYSVPDIKLTSV